MILFSTGNLWLFTRVHSLVGQSAVLDYLAIFFAEYSQYVIAAWFVWLCVRRHAQLENRILVVVAATAALVARIVVKSIILLFVAEPRPFVYLHFIPLISPAAGEELQSFPSGHALFFFALASATFLFNKRYGAYLLIVASIMGLSRIYVGVHWPFDIVSGALFGVGVGYASYHMYLRYSTHG